MFATHVNTRKTAMEAKLEGLLKQFETLTEETKSQNKQSSELLLRLQSRVGQLESGASVRGSGVFQGTSAEVSAGENLYGRTEDETEVSFHVRNNPTGANLPASSLSTGLVASQADDIQAEFRAIQDSYARLRVPGDLKFNGNKTGLKAQHKDSANVISNCAKYTETCLKVLVSIQEKVGDPTYAVNPQLQELFTCLYAMLRYLQEDHCALVVASNFGPRTQSVFKNIRKNTSAFTPELIADVRTAATLASIPQEAPTSTQSVQFRGRGYSGWRGGPRGPSFNSFRSRGRGFMHSDISVPYTRTASVDRMQNQSDG